MIGDVQPQAKRSSDPDVQIISETSQSSKPSMKDQLEQQTKALQDIKKEQSAVSQVANPAGGSMKTYQRKGKKTSSSISSDTISSLDVHKPMDPSDFIVSEGEEQAAKEAPTQVQSSSSQLSQPTVSQPDAPAVQVQ